MGLSPLLVSEVFEVIKRLQQEGMTILIVEQNAAAVLALADIGYVLESGEITHSGEGRVLRNNEDVKEFYLGLSSGNRRSFRDIKHYRRRKRWL